MIIVAARLARRADRGNVNWRNGIGNVQNLNAMVASISYIEEVSEDGNAPRPVELEIAGARIARNANGGQITAVGIKHLNAVIAKVSGPARRTITHIQTTSTVMGDADRITEPIIGLTTVPFFAQRGHILSRWRRT